METRLSPNKYSLQRGFTAIEVAIFMVAAMVVVTIATVALLELNASTSSDGKSVAASGFNEATGMMSVHGPVIAVRGDIDIDGDDSINLSGNDVQAIARIKMVLTADLSGGIDLTPPYTEDETGTDPDSSGLTSTTVVSLTTSDVSIPEAAWSVEFIGSDDGDYFLETGERAELTVWLHQNDLANALYDLGSGTSDPFIDAQADLLIARGEFIVRIIPRDAPATLVSRTLPIELTSTVLLD